MQALSDVVRVERVMKLESRAANQIIRFVSDQLCHPGNGKMAEEKQRKIKLHKKEKNKTEILSL